MILCSAASIKISLIIPLPSLHTYKLSSYDCFSHFSLISIVSFHKQPEGYVKKIPVSLTLY